MMMPTHIVAVGGVVENEHGEILLVKDRNGWVFPGGQVESGENLMDALIREIKEESGIETLVSHLIGVYSNTSTYPGHSGVAVVPTKVMMDFVCKPTGGELRTSEETTDCRWIHKDDVLQYITAPAIRTRFQSYLDFNRAVVYMEYITKPEFEMKLRRNI
ncbi:ADP-ribose pyrophosphatase YjhB, NUDIX family [Paenibacillus sp. cl141a]|uniref:NUDIX hydrolase n=1 Tax=Paenibacillus sp. cl141a TaxID=1761877 RepID=UPI0008BF6F1D|nr:NUDIX hydrolase [Paenibacillus sp. cl141a]SEK18150.1 ADP-ribose pyrophosphatase YjhB, NUDIX family [Paenibacillus sp. cl141a]